MLKPAAITMLFPCLLLCACGGGSNGLPPQRPQASVSGAAVDAAIINGTVAVYAFSDGTPGELLGSGVTDNAGNYRIDIRSADQPILVQVEGGYYLDEVTGMQVDLLPGQALTALSNYRSGTPLTVVATTFTHLAAGLAEYDIANEGMPVASAIDAANNLVSNLVGVDILHTTPADITDPANASPFLTPGLQYGFATAALSGFTRYAALAANAAPDGAPFNSITLAQLMHNDIAADGVLDGKGLDQNNDPVVLHLGTIVLNEDIYRHALAVNMIRMAQDPNNKTAITPALLAPAASAYNDNVSAIFGKRPVIAFDEGGSNLVLNAPSGWVGSLDPAHNPVTVDVTLTDAFGFAAPPAFALDGSPLVLTNPTLPPALGGGYAFQGSLDTSAIPEGAHTLSVSATDYIGTIVTRNYALNVDHTPPQFCINGYWANASGYYMLPNGSVDWSGAYRDNLSGTVSMTVNGDNATLTENPDGTGSWVVPGSVGVTLPDFDITLTDAAGNVDHFTSSPTQNFFAGPACTSGWF
ncbi:MAG: hypothetical protein ACYDDO_04710 [Acidiferrobacterales bacterium]